MWARVRVSVSAGVSVRRGIKVKVGVKVRVRLGVRIHKETATARRGEKRLVCRGERGGGEVR